MWNLVFSSVLYFVYVIEICNTYSYFVTNVCSFTGRRLTRFSWSLAVSLNFHPTFQNRHCYKTSLLLSRRSSSRRHALVQVSLIRLRTTHPTEWSTMFSTWYRFSARSRCSHLPVMDGHPFPVTFSSRRDRRRGDVIASLKRMPAAHQSFALSCSWEKICFNETLFENNCILRRSPNVWNHGLRWRRIFLAQTVGCLYSWKEWGAFFILAPPPPPRGFLLITGLSKSSYFEQPQSGKTSTQVLNVQTRLFLQVWKGYFIKSRFLKTSWKFLGRKMAPHFNDQVDGHLQAHLPMSCKGLPPS